MLILSFIDYQSSATTKYNSYIERDIPFPTGGPTSSVVASHSVCTLDWNRGVQECIGWQ